MARSTTSGKAIADLGLRISDVLRRRGRNLNNTEIPNPKSQIRNQTGFSLLELMIAMFILIILLSVAFPTYQRSVQHARETVLKENLWQMRRSIDQFTSDKGKLPKSIDELVELKYLREKPIDPITEKDDWDEVQGEDSLTPDGEQGLKDVKSSAPGVDSDGKEYKEY
ncbi:MAG TPA: type II secretion system protein [Pyrinomonadaceae bacterium]|nr:type II secretion system protein [Pyrinomonadaceae bacterium]